VADGLAGAWSRSQAEAWGCIAGQHEAVGLYLFCGVRPGWAGAAAVLLLPHVLEYYGLQLEHLSPNSIALVAIFIHICEMFMGVRSSMRLFRRFFILKVANQHPPLIGGYYFHSRTQGHPVTSHPFPLAGGSAREKIGRWCRQTSMTDSHFLPVLRPSTALIG
jgi:hypothetical protein